MPAYIGKTLKEILNAKGMTQKQLADDTGINREDINAIANDRLSVGEDRLRRIAESLNATALDLDPSLDTEAARAEFVAFRDRLGALEAAQAEDRRVQDQVNAAMLVRLDDLEAGLERAAPGALRRASGGDPK